MGARASRALCFSADRSDRHSRPPRPPNICQHCWDGPYAAHLGFFDEPMEEVYDYVGGQLVGGYRYWLSYMHLADNWRRCVWCRFLYEMPTVKATCDSISELWPYGYDKESQIAVGSGRAAGSPKDTQMLIVSVDGVLEFQGYVHTAAANPAAQYIVARSPILNVRSPRAFSLVQKCLENCAHGHERCIKISESSAPLPTRVVDCSDPQNPRLCQTGRLRGRYLALSYVWGEAQPHQTTSYNVAAYERGIDLAVLPATIRDAIYVTRALGFRYLWADSLCIIQDSGEDQRHEIGRMHLIYRHAYLTIIAASARRVSEGFLQTRPPGSRDVRLPFLAPPSSGASAPVDEDDAVPAMRRELGAVRVRPTYTSADGAIPSYSQATEPISARGWCLQEYLMSPRAVIFTSETVQFRCQTETRNVGDAFYDPASEARLPDVLFLPNPPPVERGSDQWHDVYRRWCAVVVDYSQRAVGKPSDKLVACGAIAEAFQRVLRTDYLAGLWRATLLQDLLWRRDWDASSARPAAYRAPSWSWAAFDGRVWMLGRNYPRAIALAEVVYCGVVLKDCELRFGEVTGGSLVLRATVIRCTLRIRLSENRHELLLPSIQVTQSKRGAASGLGSVVPVLDRELTDGGWASVDSKADAAIRATWLVPLLRTDLERPTRVGGLVVTQMTSGREAEGTGRRVFRRVGMFYIRDWDALRAYGVPPVEIELV